MPLSKGAATHGGLGAALFRIVSVFMGHMKGGVAMAAIGACAGFGALCGSSLATAATMGQVTLGIMIPPPVPMAIYAILTEVSIGKLFIAAVLPGVMPFLASDFSLIGMLLAFPAIALVLVRTFKA